VSAASAPCHGCGATIASRRVLRARTSADLAALTRSWNRFDRIELVTDALDDRTRERWEARLLSRYGDCGCHAGGAAVLLTLGVLVLAGVALPGERTWPRVAIGIGVAFLAAVAGKLVGITMAGSGCTGISGASGRCSRPSPSNYALAGASARRLSRACRAASCSAAFFERPVPRPTCSPSIVAAQVKCRSCGGPSTSTTL
jgi:hypothetical protein